MLTIRLQRTGRNRDTQFRLVVTDARNAPKSGRFVEVVGSYNPKLGTVDLKKERISHWLSVGAQTSKTVKNFLIDQKLVEGRKVNNLPKKSPTKARKEK